MDVVADGRGFDFEVIEEFLGLAGVFAGDAVGLAQDAEGAEGDVFEIADGSGDQVETGGEGLVVPLSEEEFIGRKNAGPSTTLRFAQDDTLHYK